MSRLGAGIHDQHVQQRPTGGARGSAGGHDHRMSFFAAELAGERHHRGLGEDRPVRQLEVRPHPRGIHLEGGDELDQLLGYAAAQDEGLGDGQPLDGPQGPTYYME